MIFDLSGKVAIVTGSTRGIGKAIAEQMAEFGAKVVISSRKSDACEEVAGALNEKLKDKPGEATPIPCHVSHKDQLKNLVDETHKRFGKIDILVGNAGVNPFYGSSADIPDSAFEKILSHQHHFQPLALPAGHSRHAGEECRIDHHCLIGSGISRIVSFGYICDLESGRFGLDSKHRRGIWSP